MTTVSKGQMRFYKMRTERLLRAVPTLDLRRKQLNREILVWEEKCAEALRKFEEFSVRMESNPHSEIEAMVEISKTRIVDLNIAGVMLRDIEDLEFTIKPYSLVVTPPSFDIFISVKKSMLEAKVRLESIRRALDMLKEELLITTQRINLFEKKLIPEYQEEIRYIRGRLEDGERTSVMVAKIAQSMMTGE
jgi:V/A-type H+-transporting ATPase subunit D